MGDRSDSNVYIKNKIARSAEVGVKATLHKLGRDTTQAHLEQKIRELNDDHHVDGIIVQVRSLFLPLSLQFLFTVASRI